MRHIPKECAATRKAEIFDRETVSRERRLGGGKDAMQKTQTLTANRDFVRLYKRGRSFVHPGLVLYIQKNRLQENRIGITTSKKIAKAVGRNRARRIIREAYRSIESRTPTGWDFVFVARTRTISMKSVDLAKIMTGMLGSAGLLKK